jgi:hypothetical protein
MLARLFTVCVSVQLPRLALTRTSLCGCHAPPRHSPRSCRFCHILQAVDDAPKLIWDNSDITTDKNTNGTTATLSQPRPRQHALLPLHNES